MKKKQAMTLIEIMIVIFIIGIIGSVVGYNMRGSLDKGRIFKTKEAAQKVYEIIQLEEAQGEKIAKNSSDLNAEILKVLKKSIFVRNPKDLMKDGWGEDFTFFFDTDNNEIRLSSAKYDAYCEKKGIKKDYPWIDADLSP